MILIRTKRLLIRHVENDDSQFILQLLNSENWLKYIGDKEVKSLKDALNYILKLKESYQRNGFGLYVMDTIGQRQAIGICGYVQRDFLEYPDLGFAILPEFEKNGLTYEAAKTILQYGVKKLQFNQILAITTIKNFKTVKLLRKLNMKFIETVSTDLDKQEYLLYGIGQK